MRQIITIAALLMFAPFPNINAQSTCKGKDVALETLGATSGLMLYNTYITIGAMADGHSNDVYDTDFVVSMMDEQMASLNSLDTSYSELLASGFLTDPSDVEYVKDMRVAIGYLHNEAYYLKAYVRSNSESDLDNYKSYRNKAWSKIAELLGIEE